MKDEKPFGIHIELPDYEIDQEFKERYAGLKVIELGSLRTTPERIYGLLRRKLMEFTKTSHKLDDFDIGENRTIESSIYSIARDKIWGCVKVRVTPINDIEAEVTLSFGALLFDKYWAKIYDESMEFMELFATYLRKVFKLAISDLPISLDGTPEDDISVEIDVAQKKSKDVYNKKKARLPRRDAVEKVTLAIIMFRNREVSTYTAAVIRARTNISTFRPLHDNEEVKSKLEELKNYPDRLSRLRNEIANLPRRQSKGK